MNAADAVCVSIFVVGAILSPIIATIMARRHRRWMEKRLAEGHEWGPVPVDGPLEEGGMCIHCGAWATSEEDSLCYPSGR